MAASRLRRIASLLGLSLALSSCLPSPEQPTPFPDLVFYQGAKRFCFGAEPEQWLTDVPDGHGGRAKILSIEDEYWSCRGFLLYVCALEGSPDRHLLYRYDDALGDSEFVCELSPQSEPRFFALDNDYSPGFFVTVGEKEAYAFLGEDGAVVAIEGEACPYYACKWGYATSLLTPWNGTEFAYDLEKPQENTFHFFDGTEVAIENGGRVISAGEEKVLFIQSWYNEQLAQYDKSSGETTFFGGDYTYPRGRTFIDRPIGSSSHSARSRFLWKRDYETKQITIVSFADGDFQEHVFSYGPSRYSEVDYCWWVVSSDIFLVMVYHSCLKIDLSLGTIEELPVTESRLFGTFAISPFDRTIYDNGRYRIIERYWPGHSQQHAAYYVLNIETNQLTLLQSYSTQMLYYQSLEERGQP